MYDHIQRQGGVLRSAVLARFRSDDSSVVRAVLRDLVDSGLVYRSGRGDGTSYRAREVDATSALRVDDHALLARMLLVAIHQLQCGCGMRPFLDRDECTRRRCERRQRRGCTMLGSQAA